MKKLVTLNITLDDLEEIMFQQLPAVDQRKLLDVDATFFVEIKDNKVKLKWEID